MNNEPAFPVSTSDAEHGHQDGHSTWQHTGMSMRDYFAAKAMQAYLSGDDRDEFSFKDWASAAYSMADAMMAESKR